jgi:hypothetical protein
MDTLPVEAPPAASHSRARKQPRTAMPTTDR